MYDVIYKKLINNNNHLRYITSGFQDLYSAGIKLVSILSWYGSRPEGRQISWWRAAVTTATKLRHRGIDPGMAYHWIVTGRNLIQWIPLLTGTISYWPK